MRPDFRWRLAVILLHIVLYMHHSAKPFCSYHFSACSISCFRHPTFVPHLLHLKTCARVQLAIKTPKFCNQLHVFTPFHLGEHDKIILWITDFICDQQTVSGHCVIYHKYSAKPKVLFTHASHVSCANH